MFQLQRQLQKKVFGVKFWEKIEKKAKENFNIDEHNKNDGKQKTTTTTMATTSFKDNINMLSY